MKKKNEIIIEIDDMEKYDEIYSIITRYCESYFSGHKDVYKEFRNGNYNNDLKNENYKREFSIYKFDENQTFKDLINDLGELCKYVTFIDPDSKDVLQYIGRLTISFDKIKSVKIGTHDKIDELRILKTEFGYCKGQKPDIRILETSYAVNMGYSEIIYLVSDSLDNLVKLDLLLEKELVDFDSNFEFEFDLVD